MPEYVYPLPTDSALLDAEGLRGFFWPVRRAEVVEAAERLLVGGTEALRAAGAPEDEDAALAHLAFPYFVREVMGILQAVLVSERVPRSGYELQPGPEGVWTEALRSGEPPAIELANTLVRGLPQLPSWRAPLHAIRGEIRADGLRYLPGLRGPRQSSVVAAALSPLVSAHARSHPRRVTYQRVHSYFPGPIQVRGTAGPRQSVIDALLDAVASAFGSVDVVPPGIVTAYCKDWLSTVGSALRAHLERLATQPLPRELWIGTAGIVWTRMLAHAVRSSGGTVVGHDHGVSSGLWGTELTSFAELSAVDTFVTFSHAMREALLSNARRDLVVTPELPSVEVIAAPESRRRFTGEEGGTEGVLYVPTMYPGERVFMVPVMPNRVAVDWQARLLSSLHKSGETVSVKPHPESRFPFPSRFADGLGYPTLEERFEDVATRFGILLFDWPFTTTFRQALATDVPIVLVDLGFVSFTPKAEEFLRRRVAFVAGGYDASNRAQVSWSDLHSALEQAPRLLDPSAYERYFGGD